MCFVALYCYLFPAAKARLLIDGRAHAYHYASVDCHKWDTCAPEAVLHAIGGQITDVYGHTYSYEATVKLRNDGGTVATALIDEHDWYLSKMADDIKQSLSVSRLSRHIYYRASVL